LEAGLRTNSSAAINKAGVNASQKVGSFSRK
jgi:hypothetical protein